MKEKQMSQTNTSSNSSSHGKQQQQQKSKKGIIIDSRLYVLGVMVATSVGLVFGALYGPEFIGGLVPPSWTGGIHQMVCDAETGTTSTTSTSTTTASTTTTTTKTRRSEDTVMDKKMMMDNTGSESSLKSSSTMQSSSLSSSSMESSSRSTTITAEEGDGEEEEQYRHYYDALPPLQVPADIRDMLETTELHAPFGQHLLLDMKGIDAQFLNSEERLVKAMTHIVDQVGLTLLSHHCHKLVPSGISCVGVLLESHISFHTWPEEGGVITFDLFTCSKACNSLVSAISTIQEAFGGGSDSSEIEIKWSHELRGLRASTVDQFSELAEFILSPLDLYMKRELYSNNTQYHRVDVWESLDFEDSVTHDGSIRLGLECNGSDPRWDSPEFATPSPAIYVDGKLRVEVSQLIETYEPLVHPVMFAHANPKHVALLGATDGGALREVLKHNTVQSVTVLVKDVQLMQLYKQYAPDLMDCSDFVGRPDNCWEDPSVTTIHDDYFDWLPTTTPHSLDVVIVDDWEGMDGSVDTFTDPDKCRTFISALMQSLNKEAVVLLRVGKAPDIDHPRADMGVHARREQFFLILEQHPDVKAMLVYEELRSSRDEPNVYLVLCKDPSCRRHWYARHDVIEYEIYTRITPMKSKQPSLKFFDGITQYSYQVPPKAWETIYCRREPTPFECAYRTLDTKRELHDLYVHDHHHHEEEEKKEENGENNHPSSSFEIKKVVAEKDDNDAASSQSEEYGVFATVDIPSGSYIMPDHLARSWMMTHRNIQGLRDNVRLDITNDDNSAVATDKLLQFIHDHKHESRIEEGSDLNFVEIGGTVLIRSVDDNTSCERDANVGRWIPPHPSGRPRPVFSPVYDRHRVSFEVFLVATKDIPAGTEVLKCKDQLW